MELKTNIADFGARAAGVMSPSDRERDRLMRENAALRRRVLQAETGRNMAAAQQRAAESELARERACREADRKAIAALTIRVQELTALLDAAQAPVQTPEPAPEPAPAAKKSRKDRRQQKKADVDSGSSPEAEDDLPFGQD